MNPLPGYAFSARALRRWRDERMTLVDELDGGFRATFLFDGSTCGGIPFQLVYTVRLARVEERWQVLDLSCVPVDGDDGHKRMCAYLESGDRMMENLQKDQPLVGQSLDDVLAWQPATSPAGCLCAVAARNHKWLAVLQTLHFSLAQR